MNQNPPPTFTISIPNQPHLPPYHQFAVHQSHPLTKALEYQPGHGWGGGSDIVVHNKDGEVAVKYAHVRYISIQLGILLEVWPSGKQQRVASLVNLSDSEMHHVAAHL